MARAIWSGSVSFGLVNIPVRLFPAVSRKNVRFNQLDERTGTRVRQRKVNPETGEEVPYEHIVKGYELSPDRYVTVTDEELAALDPAAGRMIDVSEFVDLADIDPVFYDNAYLLAPEAQSTKAYRLLVEAMERSGKVALAQFVMRSKKYLAAVRAKDGLLVLSTMVYADEVNAHEDLEGIEGLDDVEVEEKEVEMAVQLIESLSDEFQPEKYEDGYRNELLDLIERKAGGEEIVIDTTEAPTADKVVDLMAALEASVAEAKKARGRHPSAAGKKKAAARKKTAKKKAPAKKVSAKKTETKRKSA